MHPHNIAKTLYFKTRSVSASRMFALRVPKRVQVSMVVVFCVPKSEVNIAHSKIPVSVHLKVLQFPGRFESGESKALQIPGHEKGGRP